MSALRVRHARWGWRRLATTATAIALVAAAALEAQRRYMGPDEPNVPYDGRQTFVRVSYTQEMGYGRGRGGGEPTWHHDYPRGETHFMKLLGELTTIRTRGGNPSNILALSDSAIFHYPVLYMAEPGFWNPSDVEAETLHAYLVKGGMMIFDDMTTRDQYNLEKQIARVLPKARLVQLDVHHPVFDSFFRIKDLDYQHPYYGGQSIFYGVFEDNDPTKRMLMLVNGNNDISEYWEFSDEGMFPVAASNEAYKLGINYLVFALTH